MNILEPFKMDLYSIILSEKNGFFVNDFYGLSCIVLELNEKF